MIKLNCTNRRREMAMDEAFAGGICRCKHCGTMLWNYNPNYPQWVYPFASAIDTKLPVPPEHRHTMLDYKVSWAEVADGPTERHYPRYADISIEEWHKAHGLYGKR